MLNGNDIPDVNLHYSGLLDETNPKNQPVALFFAQQNSADTLERAMDDLDCHTLRQIGMWIVWKHARHQGL
jgi:hypothetical protein